MKTPEPLAGLALIVVLTEPCPLLLGIVRVVWAIPPTFSTNVLWKIIPAYLYDGSKLTVMVWA
jgi:hypothetical protein